MGFVFCRHSIQQRSPVFSGLMGIRGLLGDRRGLLNCAGDGGVIHLHRPQAAMSNISTHHYHHSSVYNNNRMTMRHCLPWWTQYCHRTLSGRASSTDDLTPGDDDTDCHGNQKLPAHRKVRERVSDVEKRMKDFVHQENIATVPNLLSFSRLLLSPVIGFLVLQNEYIWSLSLFVIAGFTDLFDGVIARSFVSQQSFLGSMLDPLADKLLVGVLTVSLTVVHLLPLPVTALIVARDLGLILSTAIVRFQNLPSPKTLQSFLDVRNANLKVEPFFISKVNTAMQLSLVALTLASPVFNFVDHPVIQTLWYVTAVTTIVSGLQYTFYNSVTVLKMKQLLKKK